MKWFNHPANIEELKAKYEKLAMQHHPDRGGNVEIMKDIHQTSKVHTLCYRRYGQSQI